MLALVHLKAWKVELGFVLCLGIGGRIPHGFCSRTVSGDRLKPAYLNFKLEEKLAFAFQPTFIVL